MDRSLSTRSTVVAGKGQVWADLDGEAVILGLKNGVYYGLNEVGARIWSFISQPKRVGEICDFLLGQYELDAGRCRRDVLALLEQLAAEGLLEIRDGSPA